MKRPTDKDLKEIEEERDYDQYRDVESVREEQARLDRIDFHIIHGGDMA